MILATKNDIAAPLMFQTEDMMEIMIGTLLNHQHHFRRTRCEDGNGIFVNLGWI